MMKNWREQLLSQVSGQVLEVGIGAGANLAYYPENIDLTGIDFSPNMLKYAGLRAQELQKEVTLLEMDAQQIEFENNTFDYVMHMRSENPIVGKVMDILNPLVVRVTGANINRRTLKNIENAGLTIVKNECLFLPLSEG